MPRSAGVLGRRFGRGVHVAGSSRFDLAGVAGGSGLRGRAVALPASGFVTLRYWRAGDVWGRGLRQLAASDLPCGRAVAPAWSCALSCSPAWRGVCLPPARSGPEPVGRCRGRRRAFVASGRMATGWCACAAQAGRRRRPDDLVWFRRPQWSMVRAWARAGHASPVGPVLAEVVAHRLRRPGRLPDLAGCSESRVDCLAVV